MAEDASAFAYPHCEALVREGDPDRYWASLFAPADKRPHLNALYAFNFEIARVREAVREALVGEIRLQWWRDALQGEARGDVKANPVAAALDDTIVKFRLPRHALVTLIDARIFDLYDDPMPSLNDLEGYCGETASALDIIGMDWFVQGLQGDLTMDSLPVKRNGARVDLGGRFRLSPRTSLWAGYDGLVAEGSDEHGFQLQLSVGF